MPVWLELAGPLGVIGSPTLLVRPQREPGKYKLFVTDLEYLWVEDLDRKAVIKRALNDDTEIDPSVGSDQLELLLDYIIDGLLRGPGTSLVITSVSEDSNDLILKLTADLEPPLAKLHWNIYLKRASEHEFSKEVVLPMLGELYSTSKEIPALYEKLDEKDQVISRLKGNLSNSFLSVADVWRDKRSGAPAPSEHQIPGLAPFDLGAWRQEHKNNSTVEPEDLRQALFRTGMTYPPVHETLLCSERWWQDLGKDGMKLEPKEDSSEGQPPSLLPHESSRGFDTQEKSEPSTEDELAPPKAHDIGQSTKTGVADSVHNSDTDATASDVGDPASNVRKRTRSPSTSSDFSSKVDSSTVKAQASPPSTTLQLAASPKPVPSKPVSKLGRIGGSSAAPSRSSSAVPSTQASPSKPKTKIGQIGGAKKPKAESATLSQTAQLPSRDAPVGKSFAFDANPEEEVKETEIEKANRRREMLKQGRENAGPAKKKKRF